MLTEHEEKAFIEKHLTNVPPVDTDFKTGDLVTFTNPAGIEFYNRKIIGFSKEADEYGRFIHLSGDTPYWISLHPNCLKLERPCLLYTLNGIKNAVAIKEDNKYLIQSIESLHRIYVNAPTVESRFKDYKDKALFYAC